MPPPLVPPPLPMPLPTPPMPPVLLLLDGGMGHLLKTRGGLRIAGLPYDQQFLAGAVANAEAPDVVRRAHEAYARAGADVLTANSFAAAPRAVALLPAAVRARLWRRLVGGAAPPDDWGAAPALRLAAELAAAAARLAAEAADACPAGRRPKVAGALPPLGGCCYARPGAAPPPLRAEAARQYLELARAMRRGRRRRQPATGQGGAPGGGGGGGGQTFPACDLLLAETLPTGEEALAAMDAAAALAREEEEEERQGGGGEGGGAREGSPAAALEVWVSFTLRDGGGGGSGGGDFGPPRLRGGEELGAAVARLLAHPAAAAAGAAAAAEAEAGGGRAPRRRLLSAVLVNCCAPAAAAAALPVLARLCGLAGGLRTGCYCNAFRDTTSEWICSQEEGGDSHREGLARARAWAEARHRGGVRAADFAPADGEAGAGAAMTAGAYARWAAGWVGGAGGASIVGGCCGVGPEHIERLAAALLGRQDAAGAGGIVLLKF